MLCPRILQAALVYVNTLMLQDILADPDWEGALTAEDERGLTHLVLVARPTLRRSETQHVVAARARHGAGCLIKSRSTAAPRRCEGTDKPSPG